MQPNSNNHLPLLQAIWTASLEWTSLLTDAIELARNGERGTVGLATTLQSMQTANLALEIRRDKTLELLAQFPAPSRHGLNYVKSLQRLLNSTEIDESKMRILKTPPYQIWDAIKATDLTWAELLRLLSRVDRNVDDHWVAFNQTYAMLLLKMRRKGIHLDDEA